MAEDRRHIAEERILGKDIEDKRRKTKDETQKKVVGRGQKLDKNRLKKEEIYRRRKNVR